MARWGEGDPRWLVEDRPDATNVNNWHWTEKNASNWSKRKFDDLLVGLKFKNETGTCEITEISKCEGEAAVNNRKAKLIFFYEWAIELKWKGISKDDLITGSFEILNLSEEHEIKDVDIMVNVDKTGTETEAFKNMMRTKGTDVIKERLATYLKCLKEEFSKGVILPTKDSNALAESKSNVIKPKKKFSSNDAPVQTKNTVTDLAELKYTVEFKCKAEELYMVLTTKKMVQTFTQGDCVLNPVEGGKFALYGGNVEGMFIKLIPDRVIKQKWRFKSWPQGHFSDVIIEICEKSDSTELVFQQKGIPRQEFDRTSDGWKRYYWDSIKRIFGFGSILF